MASEIVTRVSFDTMLGGNDDVLSLPREITVVRREQDVRRDSRGRETHLDRRRTEVLVLTRKQASALIAALAEALDYDPEIDG